MNVPGWPRSRRPIRTGETMREDQRKPTRVEWAEAAARTVAATPPLMTSYDVVVLTTSTRLRS